MAHREPVRDRQVLATLGVDGRFCTAVPLLGSAHASVSGLVALAESDRALRDAVAWLPGRILVLGGSALSESSIAELLTGTELVSFTGLIALAAEPDVGALRRAHAEIPMVAVAGSLDQERVRRAVRVSLSVTVHTPEGPPLPPAPLPPRHERRRRGIPVGAASVPGTISHADR